MTEEEKEPERIFKIGPFELWGKRRDRDDEWNKFGEAIRGLKESIINTIEPIVKPIINWLEKKLKRNRP